MKTSDYKLCHHENEVELEQSVRHALAEGWHIHGSLVSHSGLLVQSLIRTGDAEEELEYASGKPAFKERNH